MDSDSKHLISNTVCAQEQSKSREIGELERQLHTSPAPVSEFQRTLRQKDSELEALRLKVGQRCGIVMSAEW